MSETFDDPVGPLSVGRSVKRTFALLGRGDASRDFGHWSRELGSPPERSHGQENIERRHAGATQNSDARVTCLTLTRHGSCTHGLAVIL